MKAGDVPTSPRKASCALASVRSAEGHGGGAATVCAEAAACAPHSARSEQRKGREGPAGGCDSRTRACRPVLSLTARPRPRLHPAPLPSASCLSLSQATSYHLLPGGPPAFGPTPVTGCHCKLTQTWAPFAPEAPLAHLCFRQGLPGTCKKPLAYLGAFPRERKPHGRRGAGGASVSCAVDTT